MPTSPSEPEKLPAPQRLMYALAWNTLAAAALEIQEEATAGDRPRSRADLKQRVRDKVAAACNVDEDMARVLDGIIDSFERTGDLPF